MFDITSEPPIFLSDREVLDDPALRNHRRNKPAHFNKAKRLALNGAIAADGVTRVRLEVVKLPGGLATSKKALQRFVQRLTDPAGTSMPLPRSSTRQRQIDTAEQELAAAGLL